MKIKKNIKSVFFILKKCFESTPILWIIMLGIDSLSSLLLIYMVKTKQIFFDVVSNYVGDKVNTILFSFVCLILIHMLYEITKVFGHYIPQVFSSRMEKKLKFDLHKKIDSLFPECFEDAKILDEIDKAKEGVKNSIKYIINIGNVLTYYGVYFLGMGIYLYSMSPILLLSILCIFVPAIVTQVVRGNIYENKEDEVAPIRRKLNYYEECLVHKEYFKETRILGVFRVIKKAYMNILDELQCINYRAQKIIGIIDITLNLLTVIGYAGIVILLVVLVVNNKITVGTFAAVYYSLDELNYKMNNLMNDSVKQISQDQGTICNYVRFMTQLHIDKNEFEEEKKSKIVVENVDFVYPNTEKKVLQNINLTINTNETIAIVGENGSGKTTLARLLLGLYKPTSGTVYYNGKDISGYELKSVCKNSSAVFQKYIKYKMTVANNIKISDFNISDKNRMREMCATAGICLDSRIYTEGLNTLLSKEFGGTDLSGGQWQRVAIARALYKKYDFLLLDEPTSAIDPLEETKLYEKFYEMAFDTMAIIITHRIGAAKKADRIIVMKEGKIVEMGVHEELLELKGEYRRLYSAQEQWYQ